MKLHVTKLLSVVAGLGLLGIGPVSAQPAFPRPEPLIEPVVVDAPVGLDEAAPEIWQSRWGRPCRLDEVTLTVRGAVPERLATYDVGPPAPDEAPRLWWFGVESRGPGFVGPLFEQIINRHERDGDPSWLAWDAAFADAEGPVWVEAERAIDPRADDVTRHWRLTFHSARGPAEIRPSRACFVISKLHEVAGAVRIRPDDGVPGRALSDVIDIARACDAMAQGGWHQDAVAERIPQASPDPAPAPGIGEVVAAPEAPMMVAPANPGAAAVDPIVLLIDGPLSARAARLLRIRAAERERAQSGSWHAAAMATLIRDIAPDVEIRSYNGLPGLAGAEAGSPTGAVAGALQRAYDDLSADTGRPVVVNLSLGWPPEMGASALLRGADQCETTEGPSGQAVAEMLRRLDGLRTLIVAAGGNRGPSLVAAAEAPPAPPRPGWVLERPCDAVRGPELFFPARWDRRTCEVVPIEQWAPLVLAVGAHGRQARLPLAPSSVLMAPGVGVPLRGHSELALPPRITGTSAAAAITSGVAALQATRRLYGPLLEHLRQTVLSGAQACPDLPGLYLGACPQAPAPYVAAATGATAVVSGPELPREESDRVGTDKHAATGLGPLPLDPECPGGDCRLRMPVPARQLPAELHLRLEFGPYRDQKVSAPAVEFQSASPFTKGTVTQVVRLDKTSAATDAFQSALNRAMVYSSSAPMVKLDLKGITVPGGVEKARVWFTFTHQVPGKKIDVRRAIPLEVVVGQ